MVGSGSIEEMALCAVGLSAQQQLRLAGHTIGRPPNRPCLADLQLDVLVKEATADEVVSRDIEALELLRVLGLEEKKAPPATAP